ncbi:hypothetical protein EDB85DRAFT_1901810 [Lactarius pseudohatsudake]|nr:hypothetical protein EDB85DRAFT_1901810 [Lactarius pseudohatsudake]
MSNATNSGERMATRGDAKEKMSKVMAIVRSGGIEDSDLPEDGKTAKKGKKKSKGVKKSKDVPVSRLAELEDAFMKKAVDARSSHPRRWTVDLEDSRAKTPDSESENDGVDETAEHNERHSDAGLYAQAATPQPRSVRPQAATPRPRPVHPQKGTGEESRSEDLDTAPQVKEKAAVRGAITRVDAETANADETRPQDTDKTVKASSNSKSAHAVATHPIHKETQKPDKGPLSDYGLEGNSDNDEESDLDGPPPKNSKTKAAGKKKTKGAKAKLIREQIKSNRKLVTEARPNLENGGKKTFDTPDAKININASVSNWRHRLSPPNSPPPNSKRQKVQSVKASTIVSKVTSKAKTTSAKSASCAVVSTSTSSVLAKPARRAKRRYEELESASDASDEVEGMAPGGMDDDYDDALEQAAAVLSPLGAQAAAQRNKKNLDIRTGIASPNRTKKPKKRTNNELPGGALDAGRWSGIFIPTFLRYLGGMEKDIWAFKRKDAVHVLQAVWNTVYAGSTDGSIPKIRHLVEIGGAVHEVVHPSSEPQSGEMQSAQPDSPSLETSWIQQDSILLKPAGKPADQLLADERYIYLKTKDVVEDGVPAVKRAGRYRGPLVVLTLAQCWIDFEGSVEVPGYIDNDDFPYAALVLSATSVHRALWLWANGYISKESYDAALGQKKRGILKVLGPDGKCTKTTNFSKEQWEEISDVHVRDVWSVEQEKLQVIRGDINKAVDQIRNRKPTKRRASGRETDRSDPQTRWKHGGKVLTQVWQVIPKRKLPGTLLAIETVVGRTFKFAT